MNRILIVDDAKNIILVVKMCLEKAGYEVLTAKDGLTAIQEAQSQKPDLILLDILLPNMNGFLVFEALQEEPETADIPVVFLTAKAEKKDLDRAMSLGARDFLVKPIKQRELLTTIDKVLTGGKEDE